ncbi:MAG: ABC transporter permease [Hydrogeniiclostridium sp.]
MSDRRAATGRKKRGGNIWAVARKEFARFFRDPKMVFGTLLLPGLLIYVLYSIMGDGIMEQFTAEDTEPAAVYVENEPASLKEALGALSFQMLSQEGKTAEGVKEEIQNKEAELYVVFPESFDEKIAAYDSQTASEPAPNVEIYYNSASNESRAAYEAVAAVLDQYESHLANKFDVNSAQSGGVYDLATKEDVTGQMFSMLLPMLMMIFLFTGCMAVAPESIAGEKERGTIATLLVTPIKRSELAIGKVLSLSVISLLSGISSFLGTMLSLPKLMGSASGMDASVYQISDYLLLLAVILVSVLIIVSLISIISAYSRSVKEANTAVVPLMVVVMFIGITSMFGTGAPENPALYCIPLYNSVQSMNGIFSFHYNPVNIGITLVSNLVWTMLLIYVITRMFNSEKIMFSK